MTEEIIIDVSVNESGKSAQSEAKDVDVLATSIEGLTRQNKELREERKKLDTTTAEGSKRIREINELLDKNNKIIKDNSSAIEKQRLNVGNYKEDVVKAIEETKVFGVSVNDLSGGLSKATLALGAAGALLGGLVSAYASSAAGARDLESAQIQVNTAFTIFSNRLAQILGADGQGGGLFSSFVNAVIGRIDPASAVIAKIASDAKQGLKEIEIEALVAQQYAKEQLQLSEQQRRIRDDASKTENERLAAAKAVDVFINRREQALVEIQEKRLVKLKTLLATDSQNLDLQKEIKQVEFEIADIREDSEGKRTEALNGIIALEKDFSAKSIENQKKLSEEQTKEAEAAYVRRREIFEREAAEASERAKKELEEIKQRQALNESLMSGLNERADVFQKQQDEKREENAEKEREAVDNEIEINRLKNRALTGFIDNNFKKQSAARTLLSTLFKTDAIQETIINTRAAAIAAYKSLAGIPIIGPVLGAGAAAAATIFGLQQVAQISGVSFAAGGGDFYTKGPTMLVVGDNPGGVEHVSVRPISGKGKTTVNGNLVAMAGGGSFTALGSGISTQNAAELSTQRNQARETAALLNQVQVVLVREDFEAKQMQHESLVKRATVIE